MGIGIPNGVISYGASGPPNRSAPSGTARVSNSNETPWYEGGPLWVLIFLVVGYVLVFQTLK